MTSMQHARILIRRLEIVEKALERSREQRYPEELIMALSKRHMALTEEYERLQTTGLLQEQVAAIKERERLPVS